MLSGPMGIPFPPSSYLYRTLAPFPTSERTSPEMVIEISLSFTVISRRVVFLKDLLEASDSGRSACYEKNRDPRVEERACLRGAKARRDIE